MFINGLKRNIKISQKPTKQKKVELLMKVLGQNVLLSKGKEETFSMKIKSISVINFHLDVDANKRASFDVFLSQITIN